MSPLKWAGLLLFISSLMLILGFIAAEALYPNFSLSNNKLSDLGAKAPVSLLPVPASDALIHQPSALIFNSITFLVGILVLATSWLILKGSGNKILAALMFLVGIGAIIVGSLTEQMGMIHYVGAMMAFVLGPLAAIVSSRSVKRPLNYLFIVLGLTSLAFVPFVAMDIFNALSTYTIAETAGAENLILYPFFLWMLAYGTYLLKD
jgi:hypothetical membrane protein